MQADFSVELGAEDAALTVPWEAAGQGLRFYDLRRHPELLLYVNEATQHRELGEFLVGVNSQMSRLQSAKCDAWFSTELEEAEAVYGASCKFASYVDLFFVEPEARLALPPHQQMVERLTKLLKRAPDISAAAEFVIRRCFYEASAPGAAEAPAGADGDGVQEGFCITCYLLGYGDDEPDAHRRWGIGMKLVENAILQVSAERSGEAPPAEAPAV